MMIYRFCIPIIYFVLVNVEVKCSSDRRVKDIIYHSVDASKGFHPCFRRANGTHQFGCQSEPGGNIGVVQLVSKANETEDLNWITQDGPHYPYVVVLTPKTFTLAILKRLRDSGRVSGVLLLFADTYDESTTSLPFKYSDDQSCPNRYSSLYYPNEDESNCPENNPWNSAGQGILLENWPFPIVLLKNNDTISFLMEDCYKKFNIPADKVDWPLCAVEIDANMLQSGNSETCLRRSSYQSISGTTNICDKLGDSNWFMLLEEPKQKQDIYPDDSVILVTTKLDMVNLFDQFEVGSDSPTTGIVVLLAVANLLAKIDRPLTLKSGISNVMFAFFNGESFDYLGSSSMVYNMMNSTFPPSEDTKEAEVNDIENEPDIQDEKVVWPKINLNSLKMVLELDQLYQSESQLYAHVDTKFSSDDLLDKLKKDARKHGVNIKQATTQGRGLPPASLQSILKKRREVPGIMVSNFDQKFSNNYYHGPYDNFSLLSIYNASKGEEQKLVEDLAKVAESVAEFLFNEAYENSNIFNMNRTLMNELLRCFLVSANCNLFNLSSTEDTPPNSGKFPDRPYIQYIGTNSLKRGHTVMTERVLVYLTGDSVNNTKIKSQKDCQSARGKTAWNYYYMKNTNDDSCSLCNKTNPQCDAEKVTCGTCKKSLSFSTQAVSPAFLSKEYDFNGGHGAWTESVWRSISCKLYLKADPMLDIIYLCSGSTVLIVSFLLTWGIQKHSKILFEQN